MFPSVLILSDVLTNANNVALNITVPSVLSGIFMATSRCNGCVHESESETNGDKVEIKKAINTIGRQD